MLLNKPSASIKRKNGDFILVFGVLLLSIIGTVFIYSASNYSAQKTYNDAFYFVKKQIIFNGKTRWKGYKIENT